MHINRRLPLHINSCEQLAVHAHPQLTEGIKLVSRAFNLNDHFALKHTLPVKFWPLFPRLFYTVRVETMHAPHDSHLVRASHALVTDAALWTLGGQSYADVMGHTSV